MGTFFFIVLHTIAVLFGMWLLVITIPLHLIYSAIRSKSAPVAQTASPNTHVRCPDCRELVLREARVCKHCGCKLVPQ